MALTELDAALADRWATDRPGNSVVSAVDVRWSRGVGHAPTTAGISPARAPGDGVKLDAAERDALSYYAGAGYSKLNGVLRGLIAKDPNRLARILDTSAALRQLPDFNGVGYRAADLDPEAAGALRVGTLVCDPGFACITLDPRIAVAGNTYIVVHSCHGKDLSDVSPFPDEHEVLFQPQVLFRIEENSYHQRTGRRFVTLVELARDQPSNNSAPGVGRSGESTRAFLDQVGSVAATERRPSRSDKFAGAFWFANPPRAATIVERHALVNEPR